jgi:hypothetical protein
MLRTEVRKINITIFLTSLDLSPVFPPKGLIKNNILFLRTALPQREGKVTSPSGEVRLSRG